MKDQRIEKYADVLVNYCSTKKLEGLSISPWLQVILKPEARMNLAYTGIWFVGYPH